MKITTSGFYRDMASADYFADPCPAPSLTQSISKTLIKASPAHAWIEHPRLNPDWTPSDPKKYDIGNIAHALLLGRGKQLLVIDGFDDWRKKEAQERRAHAADAGKLGVLESDYETGTQMAKAARQQLAERGFAADWEFGDAEIVIAWREGDLWFRAMIDWLPPECLRVWDLKTTSASASPYGLDRKAVDDGWDVQAAMHERGLNVLDPDGAGRREHMFVCQESSPPYALTVVRLPESYLTMGRKKLAHAVAQWSEAMATGVWPAYSTETLTPSYPGYLEQRWLDREVAEHDTPPRRGSLSSIMGG